MTGSSPIATTKPRVSRFAVVLLGFFVVGIGSVFFGARFSGASSKSPLSDSATLTDIDHVTTADFPTDGSVPQMTERQRRGKQIYLTCISPSGDKITAILGNSSTEIPAAVLTCVNCHRHDGRGIPEGGIFPSNIRWDELTKPYGVNLPHGQSRPPYDESLLKRCVTMGLNSAGKPLDDAMPRYRMTHRDLADLVAYLQVIGSELDPGVTTDKIRIGVILPPRAPFAEMHAAVREVTSAFAVEFNENGGVYNREIQFCFSEAPARIEDRAEAAMDFVRNERLFALAGSFVAGAEGEISRQLAEQGVPLVGAVTLYPQLGFPLNRFIFYLGSGLTGQCRALVRFAVKQQGGRPATAAIAFPDEDRLAVVASAIEEQCKNLGFELQMHRIAADAWKPDVWAKERSEQNVDLVISLLSERRNLQLLNAAEAWQWYPMVYVPGAIVGPALFAAPGGFDQRVFLSFPTLPSQQPGGMNTHLALAQRRELPMGQLAAQFEALAAVQLLAHGLEMAGASLSRERLVEELETLYEYRSGFMPPMTYGPNRRVGAIGTYVVTIDLKNKKLMAVSDWVDGTPASRLRAESK